MIGNSSTVNGPIRYATRATFPGPEGTWRKQNWVFDWVFGGVRNNVQNPVQDLLWVAIRDQLE